MKLKQIGRYEYELGEIKKNLKTLSLKNFYIQIQVVQKKGDSFHDVVLSDPFQKLNKIIIGLVKRYLKNRVKFIVKILKEQGIKL